MNPGDLVQVDTLDVRPLPTVKSKHFTARDMTSRWDVIQAYRRATAGNTLRPHHSLDLFSPAEYLYKHHPGLALDGQLSHMS